jgi:hypothetical protein
MKISKLLHVNSAANKSVARQHKLARLTACTDSARKDRAVRFATALEITTDELLQPKAAQTVLRRLERIESLPQHQQNTLLKTIDGFLKGVAS